MKKRSKKGFVLIVQLGLLLLGVSFLTFTLIELSPLDPVAAYVRGKTLVLGEEQIQVIKEQFNVEAPFLVKYGQWLRQILTGDFGVSLLYKVPVSQLIIEKFKDSLILLSGGWLLSGIFGYFIGTVAGIFEKSWFDRLVTAFNYVVLSTPTFWLGMVFLMFFSVILDWFPSGLSSPIGMLAADVSLGAKLHHLVLPLLTLSFISSGNIMLYSRQKVLQEKKQPYLHFAKLNGQNDFTSLVKHLKPNTIMPAIVLQCASIGEIFGGSMLIEQVFAYPGLGKITVEAGLGGDIPLILGIVLFMSLLVFSGNQLADSLRKKIDPRESVTDEEFFYS